MLLVGKRTSAILFAMKIAIFLPNWLGDVAMATPTLRALRRHFGPQVRMVGILRPYLADVLAGPRGSTSSGFSILAPRTAACGGGPWPSECGPSISTWRCC